MGGSPIENYDTLTARDLVEAYISAYETIHHCKPTCEHRDGRWFFVEGVLHDRHWLVLEIERLRQEALTDAISGDSNPKGHIFRMIRRLSRL